MLPEEKEHSATMFFCIRLSLLCKAACFRRLALFFLHAIVKILYCNLNQNTQLFFISSLLSLQGISVAPEITLIPTCLSLYFLPCSATVLKSPVFCHFTLEFCHLSSFAVVSSIKQFRLNKINPEKLIAWLNGVKEYFYSMLCFSSSPLTDPHHLQFFILFNRRDVFWTVSIVHNLAVK